MNKAKFMLLGIGVVGVVGGALAFKTQKFLGDYICTQVKGDPGCAVKFVTTDKLSDHVVSFCTNDSNPAHCIATLTVTQNP